MAQIDLSKLPDYQGRLAEVVAEQGPFPTNHFDPYRTEAKLRADERRSVGATLMINETFVYDEHAGPVEQGVLEFVTYIPAFPAHLLTDTVQVT